MDLLKHLNKPQYEAVTHKEGPLLLLAGPGSGKTRVITHRIAYLVSTQIYPSQILALTFTNKAAREMVNRVQELTSHKIPWISTFHSFCARILRRECENLGYKPDFTIYDVDDQKRVVKQVLEELDIDQSIGVSKFLYAINRYKNHARSPEDVAESRSYWDRMIARVYKTYQKILLRNNAFDFDDLLLRTLDLFEKFDDVTDDYRAKFKYIMVDEFQDTNLPQYRIAKALCGEGRNICVTGDPDQSIYSWRGANLQNILNFESDFPDVKTIKLEQNYRSTKTILKGADALISRNTMRKHKELWTENQKGDAIQFFYADDDQHEASIITNQIRSLKDKHALSDIVVFYRTNAQSRAIETALIDINIPYIIVGSLEFYKRAEIKDVLAYLRVLVNPSDDISLLRIINNPPRSIGKTTIMRISQIARENDISIFEVLEGGENLWTGLKPRQKKSLQKFFSLIQKIQSQMSLTLPELVELTVRESGYLAHVKKHDENKDEDRYENIMEFIGSVKEYEKNSPQGTLRDFLQHISLLTDAHRWQGERDCITLMTLHAAKGLEFPVVYIIGIAEGLCPHSRSETYQEMEEERRLLFVGITRAKEKLTLSYSKFSYRGDYGYRNLPSRFLKEIPVELLDDISQKIR